jgi:hypothetical protein
MRLCGAWGVSFPIKIGIEIGIGSAIERIYNEKIDFDTDFDTAEKNDIFR